MEVMYIILAIWIFILWLNTWLAGKAGKSRAFALAISFVFLIPALIVYTFMYFEFRRKGKAEFKVM